MRLPAEFYAIQHTVLTWVLTHMHVPDVLAHEKSRFLSSRSAHYFSIFAPFTESLDSGEPALMQATS